MCGSSADASVLAAGTLFARTAELFILVVAQI